MRDMDATTEALNPLGYARICIGSGHSVCRFVFVGVRGGMWSAYVKGQRGFDPASLLMVLVTSVQALYYHRRLSWHTHTVLCACASAHVQAECVRERTEGF